MSNNNKHEKNNYHKGNEKRPHEQRNSGEARSEKQTFGKSTEQHQKGQFGKPAEHESHKKNEQYKK